MSIFNKVSKSFQWGPHSVTLETGEVARQSSGAVVVTRSESGLRPMRSTARAPATASSVAAAPVPARWRANVACRRNGSTAAGSFTWW